MFWILIFLFSLTGKSYAAPAESATGCVQKGRYCADPGGSRDVEGVPITRDCWRYEYELDCRQTSKNDCNKITPNCDLVNEECLKPITEGGYNFCTNMKEIFACSYKTYWREEKTKLKKNQIYGKKLHCAPFCLDGNCSAAKKADFSENNELTQSVALLNSLKDALSGLDRSAHSLVNIFKGEHKTCSDHPANFMNCCRENPDGWGEAIGFGKCTSDEKLLSDLKRGKRCASAGDYCKTRFLGFCVDRRYSYCCFDSVLSRIINIEARRQLGRSFGYGRSVSCSGLNLEDLKKVDLSKADFTEFYEEVVIPNIKNINVAGEQGDKKSQAEKISQSSVNQPEQMKGFNDDARGRL